MCYAFITKMIQEKMRLLKEINKNTKLNIDIGKVIRDMLKGKKYSKEFWHKLPKVERKYFTTQKTENIEFKARNPS